MFVNKIECMQTFVPAQSDCFDNNSVNHNAIGAQITFAPSLKVEAESINYKNTNVRKFLQELDRVRLPMDGSSRSEQEILDQNSSSIICEKAERLTNLIFTIQNTATKPTRMPATNDSHALPWMRNNEFRRLKKHRDMLKSINRKAPSVFAKIAFESPMKNYISSTRAGQ